MAAPTFDAASFTDEGAASGGGSFASHALSANTNCVVVCAHVEDGTATVTSINVAGNAATSVIMEGFTGLAWGRIFVYANASLGGTTPTINYGVDSAPFNGLAFSVLSFEGVDTVTPIGASASDVHAAGGDATLSVTFAASTDDICVSNAVVDNHFRDFTSGTGQTQRTASDFTSTGHAITETEAGATSVTMDVTLSSSAAANAVYMGFALQGESSAAVTLVLPSAI